MVRSLICRRSAACLMILGLAVALALPAGALPGVGRAEGSWGFLSTLNSWLEDWFSPWNRQAGERPVGDAVVKAGPSMDPNGNPLPPPDHGEVGPDMDPNG